MRNTQTKRISRIYFAPEDGLQCNSMYSMMAMELSLTDDGLNHYEDVISAVYQYLLLSVNIAYLYICDIFEIHTGWSRFERC
jgi:hypothetical protein